MRNSLGSAFLVSILIVLLVFPQPARAWGSTGHEAIACAAWQQLTPATRTRVMQLLALVPDRRVPHADGTSTLIPGFDTWVADLPPNLTDDQKNQFLFMRAATWADTLKHAGLFDTDDPATEKAGEDPAANLGFTDISSHGYWHFVDSPFGSIHLSGSKAAVPSNMKACKVLPAPVATLPATPVPNAATQIDAFRVLLASTEDEPLKAYDLVWIEHLVGDIHQPLHASVRFAKGVPDRGGNCVSILLTPKQKSEFKRSNATATPPVELHAFWDDLPGIAPARQLDLATSFAQSLPAASATLTADTDVTHWAADSLALAVSDAYAAPIGKALGAPNPYKVTDTYYNRSLKDAQSQIALAGARLAKLLNENLK